MRHEQLAAAVAYSSIFARTGGEAAENLLRLIRGRLPGFGGGPDAWRGVLGDWIAAPEELGHLSRFGARFTGPEWVTILEQVRDALRTDGGTG